jgi:uncharacterized protein
MRVILDANILISYLITKTEGGAIKPVVESCLSSPSITLIFPHALKQEIVGVWERKKALQKAIPRQRLDFILEITEQVAEIPASIEEIDSHSRDPKDDYLIAYGLVEQADYLITGDADLTVLKQIRNLKIISPVDFFAIVERLER